MLRNFNPHQTGKTSIPSFFLITYICEHEEGCHADRNQCSVFYSAPFNLARIRSFDAKGKITNTKMADELGFKEGIAIMRKVDKLKAWISDMKRDDDVTLEMEDGSKFQLTAKSLLQGEWKVLKEKGSETVELEDYGRHLVTNQKEAKMMQIKGEIMTKLTELEAKHGSVHEGLKITFRPRDVVATKSFSKGKLILIPCTTKIEETIPNKNYSGTFVLEPQDGIPLHLSHCIVGPNEADFSKSVLSPFWCMRTSDKQKDCNIEIHTPAGTPCGIPIMRNTCAVKATDVLVRYEPKRVKAPEPLIPVEADGEPVQKRRRTKQST